MKWENVEVSFSGDRLDVEALSLTDVEPCTFAAPEPLAFSFDVLVENAGALWDVIRRQELHAEMRRCLSPMFGWAPMPVGYVEAFGYRIPIKEWGPVVGGDISFVPMPREWWVDLWEERLGSSSD